MSGMNKEADAYTMVKIRQPEKREKMGKGKKERGKKRMRKVKASDRKCHQEKMRN